MSPPFLSNLRRFSTKTFKSSTNVSNVSSEDVPSSKSTSTLNTGTGSTTPPSTLPSEQSSSNLHAGGINGIPPVPQRPPVTPTQSNRYSIAGSPLTPTASNSKNRMPTSPYAPRVLSVSDNSWVHQKVLLISGQIADPEQQAIDGVIWACHHQDSFPATSWPVCDSHFKALVHLQPGPNRLRLDFVSTKVPTQNGNGAHSSWININYLPLTSSPPLDLVILMAKDSPGTFDAVPERKQREGNNLDVAIKKYKMAAYLWQAFTGEQMNRQGFGRRCFRYEEEWQPGTLSIQDAEQTPMRNEAKIHIVRCDKTVSELRDLNIAQQYKPGQKKGELYTIAMQAVKAYFNPKPKQTRYVSVLLLDSHWDGHEKVIRGHAALGGGTDQIKLAIFGSHCLQSYPSCIEEVVPAFTDCTRTDTNFVANDSNDCGSNWEAANIGIGAHMHEVGHLLGSPHQENGIMLRAYTRLNRTFTCREPFSTRTKSPGQRLCLAADECNWHRLDCLRFRYHPCFKLPTDLPVAPDDGIQAWPVDNGQVLVTSQSGIAWLELKAEGDDVCKSHVEYIDNAGPNGPPKQISLTETELRSRLPENKQKAKLEVKIFSVGQGRHKIEDFALLNSKASRTKLPNGRMGFRSHKLGHSLLDNSQPQELQLWNVIDQRKLMTGVRVYHGFALDGIEFLYEDSTSQLFGKTGGRVKGGSEFSLDTRKGEVILGFYLRAGVWIDGIQILTSLGRKSDVYGNANGGSGHSLVPPRGYKIAGIQGSCGKWVDGFQLIITR